MKKALCLIAGLLALNLLPVCGQPSGNLVLDPNAPLPPPKPALTKFNLDFPGGTPAALVKALEKATGKPLNVIIPTEDADIELPALKMNDVVTPQLFTALEAASRTTVVVQQNQPFANSYSQMTTYYGFRTADGPVTDSSIWYFHAEKPSLPVQDSNQKITRFYQLDRYLNRGLTVDDITTAIQTGWKMAGVTSPPELNYHKETKLLIAYGNPNELQTIQDVLSTLPEAPSNAADLNQQIKHLQDQLDTLNKKLAAQSSSSNPAPEKSSGK